MSSLQNEHDLMATKSNSPCSTHKALWLLGVALGGPFDLNISGLSHVGLGFLNLPFVDSVSRVAF